MSSMVDGPPVEYTVSLHAPQTQTVDLTVEIGDLEADTVDFYLPVWRPGKYEVLDPVGTLRAFHASDAESGMRLPVERIDKSGWRVTTNGAERVRVEYMIYANSLGDRTRHVDDSHAFLSGSSVFLYSPKHRDDPVIVRVEAPDGWRIATGLEPHPDLEHAVTAPNYDVLVDSPLEIGLHDLLEFEAAGLPHEIVIWGDADYDADRLREDFATIVEEQLEIFGSAPYKRYVFLIHVGKGAGGGTEHLNSTIMQTSRAALEDEGAYERFLGLVSHEFFHTWNVKQLRPSGIHPYDYQRENYTRLLWVAEGTTSYYDDLTLARGGLIGEKDYLRRIGNSINSLRSRPGRLVQSLEDSSYDAWTKFNKSSPDDVNTEVSFYSKGALVSLLLDLRLRETTGNRVSLDTIMREMYERYPLSGPGFTPEDFVSVINELSGADFNAFFEAYVRGVDEPDFETALPVVGLELYFDAADDDELENEAAESTEEEPGAGSPDPPMKAYLGVDLSGARVRAVRSDGPAYHAGIIVDDELLAVDGRRVRSGGDLDEIIEGREPGDAIEVVFFRRDDLRSVQIELLGVPDGEWKIRRVDDPSDEQRAAYETWIGHAWPGDGSDEENEDDEDDG
ncbi:MAG: M61 family metallopeptidase [Phycisphaerales bacterium]